MIEDVLVNVRAALRTNLPAALNVEDAAYAAADVAEFGAAIVLADVLDDDYTFEEATKPQELPAIRLLPVGTRHEWLLAAQVQMVHSIRLVVYVPDTNDRTLARRLFRTVEAIRRVLSQFVEGGAVTYLLNEGTVEYGAPENHLGGKMQGAAMHFDCAERDDRP